jgi:hypothetical protein
MAHTGILSFQNWQKNKQLVNRSCRRMQLNNGYKGDGSDGGMLVPLHS